jgi:hypothetical protein
VRGDRIQIRGIEESYNDIQLKPLIIMSKTLTLELSDELYATLQQQASAAGLSVAEWLIVSVQPQHSFLPQGSPHDEAQREEQRQQLLQYAGVIGLGQSTGADNESIDADLARAYANDF